VTLPEPPTSDEIADAMVTGADPCVRGFFSRHSDETFFAFALELLSEEGYFQLGAGSLEILPPMLETYARLNYSRETVMNEIRWNNQEWPYFDFNLDCPQWKAAWEPMKRRIADRKAWIRTLDGNQYESAQTQFEETFQAAGRMAFERLLAAGVLDGVAKTDDFRAWVFEHVD
jgi:hypothetical protein